MDVSQPAPSFQIQHYQRPWGKNKKQCYKRGVTASCNWKNNLLGLNGVTRDVEWVAHDVGEGIVQFSEHLTTKKADIKNVFIPNENR